MRAFAITGKCWTASWMPGDHPPSRHRTSRATPPSRRMPGGNRPLQAPITAAAPRPLRATVALRGHKRSPSPTSHDHAAPFSISAKPAFDRNGRLVAHGFQSNPGSIGGPPPRFRERLRPVPSCFVFIYRRRSARGLWNRGMHGFNEAAHVRLFGPTPVSGVGLLYKGRDSHEMIPSLLLAAGDSSRRQGFAAAALALADPAHREPAPGPRHTSLPSHPRQLTPGRRQPGALGPGSCLRRLPPATRSSHRQRRHGPFAAMAGTGASGRNCGGRSCARLPSALRTPLRLSPASARWNTQILAESAPAPMGDPEAPTPRHREGLFVQSGCSCCQAGVAPFQSGLQAELRPRVAANLVNF